MIETMITYLHYPFVCYAFVVGILIALCSSVIGVTLVLKHYSYIGDGLSHVAFGAMAIANVLKLTDKMPIILFITVICAIIMLRPGRIHADASIAMISVGTLAFGYLLMNIFSPPTNLSGDVCSTLFGSTSILTLTKMDVILCVIMSFFVIGLFILLYNRIFAVTFDETFARSCGENVDRINFILAIVVGVIIVLAMNLVGSLLVSSLIIFPSVSAMQISKNYLHVTVISAVLSVLCAFFGITVSILLSTPVGSTIVAVQLLVFLLCSFAGRKK